MAQAAPALGAARSPNVFDERTHRISRVAVPVALGLVYGYWVAANDRAGGPITGGNLLLGFISALVFAVVCMGLLAVGPRLRREVHALAWTAFVGCAFGFMYSATGAAALRSVGMALAVSGATLVAFFYWYYTHEDAEGHRVR
ncbi:hypothetical protein [Streptomyces sp. NK08204]|uniref:hypothetical protein n=1 Tax=Streptomyces sp. NK08204 TaxID=2873260 RepID=UPI001CED13D4|nr:hypothetical protein [Streptomyces sp. NK08204]